MDTADNDCPRLSHLVSGGCKGAGEETSLALRQKFSFLFPSMIFSFSFALHLWMDGASALLRSDIVSTGVQSPLGVLD
jgi:hypothetical protein